MGACIVTPKQRPLLQLNLCASLMEQDYKLFTDEFKEPVNILRWVLLLLTWDGILPLVMVLTLWVTRLIWPGDMMARDFAVVLIIILGLFVRVIVGLSHIRDNDCSAFMKRWQKRVLYLMAFFLLLMDALLTEIEFNARMPKGDAIFLLVSAVIYLSCMAFVLFPGRKQVPL